MLDIKNSVTEINERISISSSLKLLQVRNQILDAHGGILLDPFAFRKSEATFMLEEMDINSCLATLLTGEVSFP